MSKVIAALDVGGTKIAGGLVVYEAAGDPPRVVHQLRADTDAQAGGPAVLATIARMAGELVEAASGEGLPPVSGIGVGAAGVIDPQSGSVRFANDIMPGWTGQPLQAHLQDATGLPVATLGDVHAHALGEARWGAARGAQSCLVVGIGTGLGGAYVLDGDVVRGFHGAAGHIGHSLHPEASGMACACGADAHVEAVVSGTAISAAYQGKGFLDKLDSSLMGDVVAARANAGEPEAMAVIEAAGRALGQAIGSWCNILDPELVVLSGSVTAAGPLWRRAVDEGFKSHVLKPLADTPLMFAALGDDAALVGAAENLLDHLDRTAS